MNAIRSPKDFWIGVIYLSFGIVGLWVGRHYSFGSPGRMGPGYFPAVVSALLVIFGAVSVIRSFVVAGDPVGHIAVKSLVLILASIVAFGLLYDTAGLIIAVLVLTLMSASASRYFAFDIKAALGLVILVAFCALVFVKGLNVPMPLVGPWLQPLIPTWLGF